MRHNFIGVIPAAGRAVRLSPFRYPKELLPIVYEPGPTGAQARPLLAIEYTLRALQKASIERAVVILSSSKTEILRVLGDGAEYGMSLAYVNQEEANGLAQAVDAAYPWLAERPVVLALPDTVFEPIDAPRLVCQELCARQADVLLGVFPTDRPEQLGPVRMEKGGRVVEVQDKPARTDVRNTWGIAAWSPAFGRFVHEQLARVPTKQDIPLGALFDGAIREGLQVEGLFFEEGRFSDAGTPEGIASVLTRGNLPLSHGR